MAKRLLVTGGSGFIGTNLILHLRSLGWDILSFDRLPLSCPAVLALEAVESIVGDVTDAEALATAIGDFSPDFVVHLASRTDLDSDRLEDYAENFLGAEALLSAVDARGSKARLVVASTMLVHELGIGQASLDGFTATTAYGRSKAELERIIRARGDLDWVIVRPTTIWGPWHLRWADAFVRRVARGQYWHPSRSPCRRSYGYVGNVCHQLHTIMTADPDRVSRRTFYVGDAPFPLDDFVDAFYREFHGTPCPRIPRWMLGLAGRAGDILRMIGVRFPMTSFRLVNMTSDNIIDMSDTLRLCGDGPVSLAEGVRVTRAWFDRAAS